jgi:hypothetical protein
MIEDNDSKPQAEDDLEFKLVVEPELEIEPEVEPEEPDKVLHLWRGKNSFLLNGKVVIGPNNKMYLPYIFINLLAIVDLLFFTFIVPTMVFENRKIIVESFTCSMVLLLIFTFLTIVVEPGIVPPEFMIQTPFCLNIENNINKAIIRKISSTKSLTVEEEEQISKENSLSNQIDSPDNFQRMTVEKKDEIMKKLTKTLEDLNSNSQSPNAVKKSNLSNIQDTENIHAIEEINPNTLCQQIFQNDLMDENKPEQEEKNNNEPTLNSLCHQCNIFKLELTKHCPTCDVCVRHFVCHSGLLNVCIGKRNMRFYCLFIYFLINLPIFGGLCASLKFLPQNQISEAILLIIRIITILEFAALVMILFFVKFAWFTGKIHPTFVGKNQLKCIVTDENFDLFFRSPTLISFSKPLP